jgi:hypothetical protein
MITTDFTAISCVIVNKKTNKSTATFLHSIYRQEQAFYLICMLFYSCRLCWSAENGQQSSATFRTRSSMDAFLDDYVLDIRAGLAIKNPPKKTRPIKPKKTRLKKPKKTHLEVGFIGFF